jgi:uncharacterized integral membrane protein (TIGR00697 family)
MIDDRLFYLFAPDVVLKLGFFQIGPFLMSVGVIPWPVVFLTTDLVNEYYGKRGVRQLTFLGVGMISYAFLALFAALQIPAVDFSPVSGAAFNQVFGQSLWIIVGSLTAFALSQLTDVLIFHRLRRATGPNRLWLRATGSTVFSQLVDTIVILGIAFYLPGKLTGQQFISIAVTQYPVHGGRDPHAADLRRGHGAADRFLGPELAHEMALEPLSSRARLSAPAGPTSYAYRRPAPPAAGEPPAAPASGSRGRSPCPHPLYSVRGPPPAGLLALAGAAPAAARVHRLRELSARVGGLNTAGTAEGVAIAGSYAYAADGLSGLKVTPSATRPHRSWSGRSTPAGPFAAVQGDHAAADGDQPDHRHQAGEPAVRGQHTPTWPWT